MNSLRCNPDFDDSQAFKKISFFFNSCKNTVIEIEFFALFKYEELKCLISLFISYIYYFIFGNLKLQNG